jgi:formylglycine-generating enzyme required for sulfatase activity
MPLAQPTAARIRTREALEAFRGGSAVNGERFLRPAKRYKLNPKTTNDMVGFRRAR